MKVKDRSILALITLVDDPDERIFEHVRTELLERGKEAIPHLEQLIIDAKIHPEHVQRIEHLIKSINFQAVESSLRNWIKSPDKNLLEGVCILSSFQYPDLQVELIKEHLYEIRKDIWLEINPKQTSFEITKTFNRIFFDYHQFRRSKTKVYTPFDYFIPAVLEGREGTELSLGIVYSIIAQSLDLPVYGVLYPINRFILAYMDRDHIMTQLDLDKHNEGILFYLNIEEKGKMLNREILESELLKRKQRLKKSFFEPASNSDVLKEYLRQIIRSCDSWRNLSYKSPYYKKLLTLFEEDIPDKNAH